MGMPVGAHMMSDQEMRGDSYPGVPDGVEIDENQVLPTVMGYRNPGPTANQRGIEANTNRDNGTPAEVTYPAGPPPEMNCT